MTFRFEKFPIYQEIREFIKDVYLLSSSFPKQEQFELASQLRRAATSILLNIAEGASKKSDLEFNRHVLIAVGSANEIVAVLDIALDQSYISKKEYCLFREKIKSIIKQLYGLSRSLKRKKL
jgi:four helix bundle protein